MNIKALDKRLNGLRDAGQLPDDAWEDYIKVKDFIHYGKHVVKNYPATPLIKRHWPDQMKLESIKDWEDSCERHRKITAKFMEMCNG